MELPRYTFYALKVYDLSVPAPLLFLRYHLFMVLYPTGITGSFVRRRGGDGGCRRSRLDHPATPGELGVLLSALPHIAEHQPFSWSLPNDYNAVFSFYYFNIFVLVALYPLGASRVAWAAAWLASLRSHPPRRGSLSQVVRSCTCTCGASVRRSTGRRRAREECV